MNKYPLDEQGVLNAIRELTANDKAQRDLIFKFSVLLNNALAYVEEYDPDLYEEGTYLIQSLQTRRMDFENLRFDQGNGHKGGLTSPYDSIRGLTPGQRVDPAMEGKLNSMEAAFGSEMDEEDLAKHFNELPPRKTKKGRAVEKMSMEEIQDWEAQQNNSNDIYKVSARVKNLAREGGASLTSVGEMLCNTFVHVLKNLYDYAETIPDKDIKIKLIEKIRSQEKMPADFIAATAANVREGKQKR